MSASISLLLGVTCAGVGGELFLRGVVGLARWARISPGIVAATLAAFATSSPEFSVGIGSALAGTPQISFGDVLGSNVVNVGLIMGITLVIGAIRATRAEVQRDFPVALLVPFIIGALAADGVVSRTDGLVLLAVFAGWFSAVVWEARRQRNAVAKTLGERRHGLALVFCAVGLALLMAAGRLIVAGASGIAAAWGLNDFVVGTVIVAIGTSVPELATSVAAKFRGHDEVGLGTILGSNIFNSLWIVGVVAMIHPIIIPLREVALSLAVAAASVALTYPSRSGCIGRVRGLLLLMLYVTFLVTTLKHHPDL